MNKPLVILLLALAPGLFGQATSQITGIVTDSTGSPLPEAKVTARHTDTGRERIFTTEKLGIYVFSNLPIGEYQITVTKPDFKTVVHNKIVLQVASPTTLQIPMQVGALNETITVTEDAELVDTQNTSIGAVIDRVSMESIPINGRNPNENVFRTPAAVPGGKNITSGFPNGLQIAVAGGQLSGVGYTLDDVMYNNLFDSVSMPFPFPDALQEFKVETSTMTAKSGTHAAARVSASLKSGSNQFHGNLFEFFRNGIMNARNAYASRRDTLKRNQFGGTIGGPIVRNTLFFFAGYQGTLTRSDPDDKTAYVPDAQMLAGDFSCFKTSINDPNGGAFQGNQIPVNRFSQEALNLVAFLPQPTGPCGKVSYGAITKSDEHQVLGRSDYMLNSRNAIFVRYMVTTYAQPAPYALSGNVLDTVYAGLDDLAQSAAFGHTYTRSTVFNQLRVGFNRVAVRRFNKDYFSGCDLGVKIYCGYVPHQTVVSVGPVVGGSFNVGTPAATPGTFIPTTLTLSDDVTAVSGAHTLAFGYSSFKYQHSQQVNVSSVGLFSFPGGSTGLGMTDFMLGKLGSLVQSAPSEVYTNKWGHSLYAQDTWKISRRFTLNYGLRWEPFLPQALNDGAVYNFSMDAFREGVRSQVYPNAPPGLSYPGDPGFHGKTGVNKRWNQFAPRVGIAYDPSGKGMTSIRASAGIAYDFPNLQIMNNPVAAPPFSGRVMTAGPVELADPYEKTTNPFPYIPGTFPSTPSSFVAQQPNAKGPTTYMWNFSVQHQFGRDWVVAASYLGSQSIHAWVSQAINPGVVLPCSGGAAVDTCNKPNNIDGRRVAYLTDPVAGAQFGSIDMFESGGGSNYHGLILNTQKRLGHGVSLNANYTWSHCLGDLTIASGPGGPTGGSGTYTDLANRRRDRGGCSTQTAEALQALDRRHIFNFTTVMEAPQFENRTMNQIASNWRFAAGYRFLSAPYLTVTTGTDRALTGVATGNANGYQRANLLSNDVYCKPRTADCWINRAAFGLPAFGTLGNLGRATIAGPGYFGLDIAVSRVFRLRESISLEARGEAFNLTNSVRLNAPATTLNSPVFGKVQESQDPRILQLALRVSF